MKKALYLLKRYQLIEVPDSMEELNENTRIIIFPSINVVLMLSLIHILSYSALPGDWLYLSCKDGGLSSSSDSTSSLL